MSKHPGNEHHNEKDVSIDVPSVVIAEQYTEKGQRTSNASSVTFIGPTENDIILGRGSRYRNARPNQEFGKLIQDRHHRYVPNGDQESNSLIVEEVTDELDRKGVRVFRPPTSKTSQWTQVVDTKLDTVIATSLRDKQKNTLKRASLDHHQQQDGIFNTSTGATPNENVAPVLLSSITCTRSTMQVYEGQYGSFYGCDADCRSFLLSDEDYAELMIAPIADDESLLLAQAATSTNNDEDCKPAASCPLLSGYVTTQQHIEDQQHQDAKSTVKPPPMLPACLVDIATSFFQFALKKIQDKLDGQVPTNRMGQKRQRCIVAPSC